MDRGSARVPGFSPVVTMHPIPYPHPEWDREFLRDYVGITVDPVRNGPVDLESELDPDHPVIKLMMQLDDTEGETLRKVDIQPGEVYVNKNRTLVAYIEAFEALGMLGKEAKHARLPRHLQLPCTISDVPPYEGPEADRDPAQMANDLAHLNRWKGVYPIPDRPYSCVDDGHPVIAFGKSDRSRFCPKTKGHYIRWLTGKGKYKFGHKTLCMLLLGLEGVMTPGELAAWRI
jgi:hypothetical protein